MTKNWLLPVSTLTIILMIGFGACKKDDAVPDNPYDDVDYNTGGSGNDTVDPNSITGIHRNIFITRCALPGCHDGNFEPDFRSVQSSYATLVYHPVIKNNANNDFTFRVVPYDTAKSVLHERITNCCFVNQDDRMPQDNIGVPMDQEDIDHIANWILNGARDINGQVSKYPNLEPTLVSPFYVAIDDKIPPTVAYSDQNNRVDSIIYKPFFVPNNVNFVLAFYVDDDSTAIKNLLVNQVKMSLDPDDFSTGWQVNASYLNLNPDEIYIATINTSSLPKDTTIFFRYYMNDGDHSQNTEFLRDGFAYEYKTYFAFRVKP
ncbi:MAG: hypothetical protein KDD36_00560 [Flavobacteriales bacterium]|nr:hypothetical protein [Flavobacteriales bacterium]